MAKSSKNAPKPMYPQMRVRPFLDISGSAASITADSNAPALPADMRSRRPRSCTKNISRHYGIMASCANQYFRVSIRRISILTAGVAKTYFTPSVKS